MVGSNIFNILLVLGVAGVVGPGPIDDMALTRDFPLMICLAFGVYLTCVVRRNSGQSSIPRWAGASFVLIFGAYQLWIAFSAMAQAAIAPTN